MTHLNQLGTLPLSELRCHFGFAARSYHDHCRIHRPKLLPFDHIRPTPSTTLSAPPRTAILYSDPHSSNLRDLHNCLYKLSSGPSPRVEYVFRHAPPSNRDKSIKTYLSGYGVALDLKKTDYLAVDDRYTSKNGMVYRINVRVELTAAVGRVNEDSSQTTDKDPIQDIISSFPENDTAERVSTLSGEDLAGMNSFCWTCEESHTYGPFRSWPQSHPDHRGFF